jgi:hypothetical protein
MIYDESNFKKCRMNIRKGAIEFKNAITSASSEARTFSWQKKQGMALTPSPV